MTLIAYIAVFIVIIMCLGAFVDIKDMFVMLRYQNNALELKVIEKQITLSDDSLVDIYEISFKGTIFTPNTLTDRTVNFKLMASDYVDNAKSEEDRCFLRTNLDDYSSDGSGILSLVQKFTLKRTATTWKDWTTLFAIPISYIDFPYHGQRNIEFVLFVDDLADTGIDSASIQHNTFVSVIGYMDIVHLMAEKKAVEIAVMLAIYNSETLSFDTEQVIKQWISNKVELKENHLLKEKTEKKLLKVFNSHKESELCSFANFRKKLKKLDYYLSTEEMKYDIMAFWLQVAASFEILSKEDKDILDFIADELHLNQDEYQTIKHEYLT